MNEPYKVAIILGTRAELIKTFPVMLELQKRKISYYFIHTGQHSLRDLCEKFKVNKPNIILSKEPKTSSKFNTKSTKAIFWNLGLIFKIKNELNKLKGLKYVLYHGDTMTTATAAFASSKLFNPSKHYKNVHLEAGLRSNNLFEPFPEEISRIIADRFSDILFAVSKRAEKNLSKYQNKKEVITIGNTVVDSASIAYKMALKNKTKPLSSKKFTLISIHRHENIKNSKRLGRIVKILSTLQTPSYFMMHDNTLKKLQEFNLIKKIQENPNIKIIKPLDYPEFIFQLSKCSLIICDGGSLQEESLIFKKPCIILRRATERQEGLTTNFQFLSNLNIPRTLNKIEEFSSKDFKIKKFNNPYGEKGLSSRIVEFLK